MPRAVRPAGVPLGKLTSRHRDLARFAACYGLWERPSYEEYIGLLLNAPRAALFLGNGVGHAFSAATTDADLPREYADALACDDAEVDELHSRINAPRHDARAARCRPRGGGVFG